MLAGGAQAADAPWVGVWSGAVGDYKVMACFTGGYRDNGAYYYLDHRAIVRLRLPEKDAEKSTGVWNEEVIVNEYNSARSSKITGRWTIQATKPDSLTGTWTYQGKTLPIRLSRVAVPPSHYGEQETCGSMAFMKPRLVKTAVVRKRATLDGADYIVLTLNLSGLEADVQSFALPAETAADRKINAGLAAAFEPPAKDDAPEYANCLMGSLGDFAEEGEYHDIIKPELITRRWLVSERSDGGSCGGAHPDFELGYTVWDRTTGAVVDGWKWISAEARRGPSADKGDDDHIVARSPILKRMQAHWKRGQDKDDDESCRDLPFEISEWDIRPTREGLAFFPHLPHVIMACSDDAVIPYKEIARYLSPEGKKAIASIMQDLKTLPPKPKAK